MALSKSECLCLKQLSHAVAAPLANLAKQQQSGACRDFMFSNPQTSSFKRWQWCDSTN